MMRFSHLIKVGVFAVFPGLLVGQEVGIINASGVKTIAVAALTQSSARQLIPTPEVTVGDILPLNYFMVVNLRDYDLPRPSDGWVYFEVKNRIYRVDLNSREVLEFAAHRIP